MRYYEKSWAGYEPGVVLWHLVSASYFAESSVQWATVLDEFSEFAGHLIWVMVMGANMTRTDLSEYMKSAQDLEDLCFYLTPTSCENTAQVIRTLRTKNAGRYNTPGQVGYLEIIEHWTGPELTDHQPVGPRTCNHLKEPWKSYRAGQGVDEVNADHYGYETVDGQFMSVPEVLEDFSTCFDTANGSHVYDSPTDWEEYLDTTRETMTVQGNDIALMLCVFLVYRADLYNRELLAVDENRLVQGRPQAVTFKGAKGKGK
jgi:hypothetical protein